MATARTVSLSRRTTAFVSLFAVLAILGLTVGGSVAFGARTPSRPASYTIWDSSTAPRIDADPEVNPVQLGVKFTTAEAGSISAIRYYKSDENTGSHWGALYDASGRTLAKVTFTSESSSGWQEATLTTPVQVESGATYVASYFAPAGRYADDVDAISPAKSVRKDALTAVQGVYSYGRDMPTLVWNDSNYYVDVRFTPNDDAGSEPTATSTSSSTTSSTTTTNPSSSSTSTTSTNPSTSTSPTTDPTTSPTSATSTTRPPTTTATRPSTTTTTSPSSTTTTAPSGPVGSQTNCISKPSACGYPDSSNTGFATGSTLRKVPAEVSSGPGWHFDSRGWITIDGSNVTVSNLDLEVTVEITGTNVTFSNSRVVVTGESWGVGLKHSTNATIANNEIYSPTADGPDRLLVGIKDVYGDAHGTKVIGNEIYHTSTGVQTHEGLIQGNYIHSMGYNSGDHLNGTTSNGSTEPLSIIGNTVLNDYGQTDAISLFQDFGREANRLIQGNLVAGGGYTIYGGANAGARRNVEHPDREQSILDHLLSPRGRLRSACCLGSER